MQPLGAARREAAYPYHFHYADEELAIVLSGTPELRTPDGTRELEEGEIVHFPLGERGAHQLINGSDAPVTFLAISSHGRPDVVVYPDAGKVGVGERLPRGGGLRAFFRQRRRRGLLGGRNAPRIGRAAYNAAPHAAAVPRDTTRRSSPGSRSCASRRSTPIPRRRRSSTTRAS